MAPDADFERVSIGATTLLVLPAEGPLLSSEDDAVDLVGALYGTEADWVAIPIPRLAPAFFVLSNRMAGLFLQKLVNYRLAVAIVGDIAPYTETSSAWADFVRESNRTGQFAFVRTLAELETRLRRL